MSLGLRHAERGDRLSQQVRVEVTGRPAAAPGPGGVAGRPGRPATGHGHPAAGVRLTVDPARPAGTFPLVGLGAAADGRPLSAAEAGLLRALRLSHLRADVRLRDGEPDQAVADAAATAAACGCGLELAVFTDTGSPGELAGLRQALSGRAGQISRLLAFSEHELVTPAGVVAAVREAAVRGRAGVRRHQPELRRDQPGPPRPRRGRRLRVQREPPGARGRRPVHDRGAGQLRRHAGHGAVVPRRWAPAGGDPDHAAGPVQRRRAGRGHRGRRLAPARRPPAGLAAVRRVHGPGCPVPRGRGPPRRPRSTRPPASAA